MVVIYQVRDVDRGVPTQTFGVKRAESQTTGVILFELFRAGCSGSYSILDGVA